MFSLIRTVWLNLAGHQPYNLRASPGCLRVVNMLLINWDRPRRGGIIIAIRKLIVPILSLVIKLVFHLFSKKMLFYQLISSLFCSTPWSLGRHIYPTLVSHQIYLVFIFSWQGSKDLRYKREISSPMLSDGNAWNLLMGGSCLSFPSLIVSHFAFISWVG